MKRRRHIDVAAQLTLSPWRKAFVLALVLVSPLCVVHCSGIKSLAVNVPAVVGRTGFIADVPFADGADLRLDVFSPSNRRGAPTIVFLHGGAWIEGSKEDFRFIGAVLADAGYLTVIPQYRLFPEVKFPTFVEDAAQAVAWARRNAARYGGDPGRLFLMGHSAGAHIAALVAFDDRYLSAAGVSPGCVRGFIGISGPYALELRTPFLHGVFPAEFSADDWQPIRRVTPLAPPTLLLHGQSDWMVQAEESIALGRRLKSLGVPVRVRLYSGRSHRDLITAWWPPLQHRTPVLHEASTFIDSVVKQSRSDCGRPETTPSLDTTVASLEIPAGERNVSIARR